MDFASLEAAGWSKLSIYGFIEHVGALWVRGTGAQAELGFLAEAHHANHVGNVHGGMLMTFADNALGYGVVQSLGHSRCATAQLNTHFVAGAKTGDFVTCQPQVVRRTSQLVFVRGLMCVGEKVVASADGIWKVLEARNGG